MSIFTKDDLKTLVKDKLSDYKFIVVSNREPYIHKYIGNEIQCLKPASGLTTAVDPIMLACDGTWVAHGSGDADKDTVDKNDRVRVPPKDEKYTIRRVWMDKAEETGFYYGFSNETMWPLCHIAYNKPTFSESDWNTYKKINQRFADTVIEELEGQKAFIFIQDYHFALLPKMIKEKCPDCIIAHFWHIPWPNPEVFRINPWKEEIIQGLLANDLLGFHIRYHCDNFLNTVDTTFESLINREHSTVTFQGHVTKVTPQSISIDYEHINKVANSKVVKDKMSQFRKQYGLEDDCTIAVGVDRIDYTKGIPERLKAIDRFLEKYPEHRGKFTYFQVGALSRIHIKSYKELNDEINDLVESINWKYSTGHWSPINMFRRHLTFEDILAFYRLSDICIVSSLHDGMNLVVKEFIAASDKKKGIPILSQFTGASRDLIEAILINPYDTEKFADSIKLAIELPQEEKEEIMAKLQAKVEENNIYKWASDVINELVKIS